MAAVAEGIGARVVLDALDRAAISSVVTVPDTSQGSVLDGLDGRGRPRLLRAATEDDVLGICAGLWMAGERPLALIQQLGLFASANSLRAFTHDQNVPLAILAGLYGRARDRPLEDSGASAVRLCLPLLEALDLRYALVEGPAQVDRIGAGIEAAFDERCTSIVLLGAPTT